MTQIIEEVIENDEYEKFMLNLQAECQDLSNRVNQLIDELEVKIPARFMNTKEVKQEIYKQLNNFIIEIPEKFVKKTLCREVSKNNKKIDKNMSIDDLEFTLRTYKCLMRENIKTLDQLLKTSIRTLKNIQNFGRKSLQEVIDVLSTMGLELKK